jgi:hypothetical protein
MSKRIVWHVAPLQRVVAEEITDPAEQAAIDRARLRAKQKRSRNGKRTAARSRGKKSA